MLKRIKVADLSPGMMVTSVLEQSGPMRIRKVGMIRSPDMIRGLKEMGVTLLEVDLDQSLNVEFEDDPVGGHSRVPESNAEGQKSQSDKYVKAPRTATQRLVATDKQIADVDRQLSQQFHRSLFLPAVDQMPSKWTLYGKPYSYLLVFICLGFTVGWIGASVPKWWLDLSNQVMTQNRGTANQAKNEARNPKGTQGQDSQVQETSVVDTLATTRDQAPDNENQHDKKTPVKTNATVETAQNTLSTPPKQNQTAQDVTPPIKYESVNGVLLEAGQQVLGYQVGADEDAPANKPDSLETQLAQSQSPTEANNKNNDEENPVISNAPGFTTISQPRVGNVDNDLLRRIQRAADAVDKQPEEQKPAPIKVTELNSLSRIDQLPPAILTQMPSMSFSAHMYASNPEDRWVRVNGKRIGEGGYITDSLQIKRIESEKVVLEFRDREFTMNALTDW